MKNPEIQELAPPTCNTFESISASIQEAQQSHSRGEFLFSLDSPLAHSGFSTVEKFRELIQGVAFRHGQLPPEYIFVEPLKSDPSHVLVILDYEEFYLDEDEETHKSKIEKRADQDRATLEEASMVELDPNLPQSLKELDAWPKEVPNFDIREPQFTFQLGELPCYAGIGLEEVSTGDPEMLGVYMLWTDPAYRRKGLGRQMVNLLRRRFPRLTAMPVSEDGIEFAKHLNK